MSINYDERIKGFQSVSECENFKKNAVDRDRPDLAKLAENRSLEIQKGNCEFEFTTYENTANPHTTIHKTGCSQIKKNGGVHNYGNGQYREHSTYSDAFEYAKGTNLPINDCSFCL